MLIRSVGKRVGSLPTVPAGVVAAGTTPAGAASPAPAEGELLQVASTLKREGGKGRRAFLLLLTTLALLFTGATAAQAHPTGPNPDQVKCWSWVSLGGHLGTGCFEWYGDEFWVRDTEPDGYSVKLYWESAQGWSGSCRNSHGYDTWHKCDGTDYISEQDDVRWWLCLTDGPDEVEIKCTTDFSQPKSCWTRADNGRGTLSCNRPRSSAPATSSKQGREYK